jgi:hypothetical protein
VSPCEACAATLEVEEGKVHRDFSVAVERWYYFGDLLADR